MGFEFGSGYDKGIRIPEGIPATAILRFHSRLNLKHLEGLVVGLKELDRVVPA
ncbi:MAG: hypothetical protein BWY82_02055 [Verrucomicrobia bacterium ADurb.Bin474]|nr:MAG: hypothetical protein BWY82_02055 [Verrucomicrobia bacterium ADurb.Bin474]